MENYRNISLCDRDGIFIYKNLKMELIFQNKKEKWK